MVSRKTLIILIILFLNSCLSSEYIYFNQWDTGNYLHYIKLNKFKRYKRIYAVNQKKYIDYGKWYLKNDSIFLVPDFKFKFDTIPIFEVNESFDSTLYNIIMLKFTFLSYPINNNYSYSICVNLNEKTGNCDTTIIFYFFEEFYKEKDTMMSKIFDKKTNKIDTLNFMIENKRIKNLCVSNFLLNASEIYYPKNNKSNTFLMEVNPNLPVLYDCVKNEGEYYKDSLIFEDKVGWLLQYNYTLTKKRKSKFIREYNKMKKHDWILSIIDLDVNEIFKN
mgnify:CR=1 FL=1